MENFIHARVPKEKFLVGVNLRITSELYNKHMSMDYSEVRIINFYSLTLLINILYDLITTIYQKNTFLFKKIVLYCFCIVNYIRDW